MFSEKTLNRTFPAAVGMAFLLVLPQVTFAAEGSKFSELVQPRLNPYVLTSTTVSTNSNNTVVGDIDLAALAGKPFYVKIDSTCAILGNNASGITYAYFYDASGNTLLRIKSCYALGVSTGESAGSGQSQIVPIPIGTTNIGLSAAGANLAQPGTGNSNIIISLDVLGSADSSSP